MADPFFELFLPEAFLFGIGFFLAIVEIFVVNISDSNQFIWTIT